MKDAIKAQGLSRSFGGVKAVDGFDLEVRRGEIFSLVGPDGAGKTTVLRMLAAVMDPTEGDAFVSGYSIVRESEKVKEKIGYMPQRFGLYEDLTVMENILFYADLFGVPKKDRPERVERLLGFSNLTPFKGRLAGRLSGGMKQKLGLACALVHTPEVILLDEPTNGVDPVSRRDFWRLLYGLLKERVTILLSTAYLDEAERSNRVGLMHGGRLLAVDEPERLKKSFPHLMFELWLDDARKGAALARGVRGVKGVSVYGDRLHLSVQEEGAAARVSEELGRKGFPVRGIRKILPSMEDIFISRLERGAERGIS